MTLKATATFDTNQQLEDFVEQLDTLNVTSTVSNQTVSVEYIGYNRTLYSLIIATFEDVRRHDIRTYT